jgi:rhodanese-related sulfurtransferase
MVLNIQPSRVLTHDGFPAPTCWQALRRVLPIGLLATCSAFAQTQPGIPMPEALKNIKPAAGVCLREAAVSPKARVFAKADEAARPDLSCAIVPAELSRLLKRPDTVLIDVRNATDYAAFHIEGVLNTTVSELHIKRFLRGKTVVLIGSGKAERELYTACTRLKTHGFRQVKVLHGGMPSWLSFGQAVLGRVPNAAQLARLTPSELWIESRFDANLLLVARSQEEIQRQLSSSMLIPDESPAAVQAAIERRRKQPKKAPLAAVVLVTAAGSDNETVQRLRQAIQPIPLLVYTNTADAYAHQLAQQKAVWAAQARGPKQPACGL